MEVRLADFYAPELREPGGAHEGMQKAVIFRHMSWPAISDIDGELVCRSRLPPDARVTCSICRVLPIILVDQAGRANPEDLGEFPQAYNRGIAKPAF